MAYTAMRLIDDYPVEILVTLALVSATYALAQALHVSGPLLSVVACELLIGDRGPRFAMSDQTQRDVFGLCTLIDEILNSVLFLLSGLEALISIFDGRAMLLAGVAMPSCRRCDADRCCWGGSLRFPPRRSCSHGRGLTNLPFLTWAGVRGGSSVALAPLVPESPAKPAILAATCAVVLFCIIVQRLTLGAVAHRTIRGADMSPADDRGVGCARRSDASRVM